MSRFVRYEFGRYTCNVTDIYDDHIYLDPSRIVGVKYSTAGQKDCCVLIDGEKPFYVNKPASEVVRIIEECERKHYEKHNAS